MPVFKSTKWKDHKFTKDQKKARSIWRRAQKKQFELVDVLYATPEKRIDREYLHERLDIVLNNIERAEQAARDLFPEVHDSFTIAKMDITL